MTDIHEKLAQTGAIEDAFRLLTEVSEPLVVLHVEAGGLQGEIWLNNDRRLFFAKATGDGDNGLMALMMMLAAKGSRFRLDLEQPLARRPNIEVVIHLEDCVKNQAGVAQKIKDILWPVNESNIDTEACEALPAEMLQAAIFGTSSTGFFSAPVPEIVTEADEEEDQDTAAEDSAESVGAADMNCDKDEMNTAEQCESRSVASDTEQSGEDEQPLLSFAPEPRPFPAPPLPTPPLPSPPLLEPAIAAAIAVPSQPEEPCRDEDAASQVTPASEPPPEAPSQPMLGANAADAQELEAPEPAAPPPPVPPLSQSGRFAAPIEHAPPRPKRFPFAAITTTAAALAILCAVGFTVYSGITSGAQALREDTDATNQFVADTIEVKSPPKPSAAK